MIRLALGCVVLVLAWQHKLATSLIGLAILAWCATLIRRPMHRWKALELIALGWLIARVPAWLRNEWLRGRRQADYLERHDAHMEKEEARYANNRNATSPPAWSPRIVKNDKPNF